ncbi:AAA family ATPase [Pokkaliibacter sp. CJK22405]|uniref:AAA family ATPase n=1 Tax=Pokkaliibacter sp. CJK22405 TaxID=3384615 RepID=UPI00398554FE
MSHSVLTDVLHTLDGVLLGKPRITQLATTCLLAGGHLLLEDVPGLGKTTLTHALASCFGLDYRRVQFTSDVLPADILGATIYHPNEQSFRFHPGAIFSQLIMADELNRASPRTQSALLEAMEEKQVSIEGQTYPLPKPFFVIATQNPQSHAGTYPLPESQLDRFLMRLSLGYPDPQAERQLLLGNAGRASLEKLTALMPAETLLQLQQEVKRVSVSEALVDYLLRLVHGSREHEKIQLGLSPRAALGLKAASQAHALLQGRNYVLPDDVQAVFIPVAAHRLVGRGHEQGVALARQLLKQTAVVI